MGSMPRGVLLGCQNRAEGLSVGLVVLLAAAIFIVPLSFLLSLGFTLADTYREKNWWQEKLEIDQSLIQESGVSDF